MSLAAPPSVLRSLLKFLIVGVLNSTVGLAAIFLAKRLGAMGDIAANLSSACAVTLSADSQ